jgi:hypothetical protein
VSNFLYFIGVERTDNKGLKLAISFILSMLVSNGVLFLILGELNTDFIMILIRIILYVVIVFILYKFLNIRLWILIYFVLPILNLIAFLIGENFSWYLLINLLLDPILFFLPFIISFRLRKLSVYFIFFISYFFQYFLMSLSGSFIQIANQLTDIKIELFYIMPRVVIVGIFLSLLSTLILRLLHLTFRLNIKWKEKI